MFLRFILFTSERERISHQLVYFPKWLGLDQASEESKAWGSSQALHLGGRCPTCTEASFCRFFSKNISRELHQKLSIQNSNLGSNRRLPVL